jgi:nucleoside-diphosphate-sugar epimerase
LISKQNLDLLRGKLAQYNQIVVTGASGWLGSETADLFFELFEEELEERVTFVSNLPKSVYIQNKTIECIGWEEFKTLRSIDLLIHFAYLNQDKVKILGASEYIHVNRNITSDVNTFLSNNSGCDLLLASSGAAIHYPPNIDSVIPMEVYAGLKLESELAYLQNKDIKSILISRIWNVTGSRLGIDSPYAISNFFKQAMRTGHIELTGNKESSRTFVEVKEMMIVFLLSLEQGQRITMDSGGFKVTFFELAELILKELKLPHTALAFSGDSNFESHYNPDGTIFNSKAHDFTVQLSDMPSQVNSMYKVFTSSLGES